MDNEMGLKRHLKKGPTYQICFLNYILVKELVESLFTVLQVIPWFIHFFFNCLLLGPVLEITSIRCCTCFENPFIS